MFSALYSLLPLVPWLLAIVLLGSTLALSLERRGYMRQLASLSAESETLQAQNWQLQLATRAKARAEAANEAKSQYLAEISHDIRTPLSGMIGMADLLSGTRLDGEQTTYTEAIRNAGQSLGQLVETLLDFSRIEAGRLEIAKVEFNLVACVEAVVELLAPRAQGKQIEISALVRPDVPQSVVGDPLRLQQILMNLAGNAVKFTVSGGVGIEVTQSDGRLVFFVRDTGIGIAPEHRAAIFGRYEQGDPDAHDGMEGSGLGLAITRRLVDEMAGTLALTQTGPEGSEFMVSLPLVHSALRPWDQPGERLGLRGRRVLIVANSPFEAPYLFHKMAMVGVKVTHAKTELEAQTILGTAPPFDAVLLDPMMGSALTNHLMQSARHAGAGKCIVLLSPFERQTFGKVTDQGYDGWLTRPVRTLSLLRIVGGAKASDLRDDGQSAGQSLSPGYRILLAEDNDINALVLTRQCERLGAEVVRVGDGKAAIATACNGSHFDCILMDLRLPEVDGISAAKAIRSFETARQSHPTRLIAVTASTLSSERTQALEAGFDGYVVKPADPSRLVQMLTGKAADPRPSQSTDATQIKASA
ncbi:MAG: response regulator [Hyphomicrobiales bacterium]|nr:response regulator [Hyphomicrobiales bacterium]MDE2115524.1 response regulator [Hyphomicrobiales bacterium]